MKAHITAVIDQADILVDLTETCRENLGNAVAEDMELQILSRGVWIPIGSNDTVSSIRFASKKAQR